MSPDEPVTRRFFMLFAVHPPMHARHYTCTVRLRHGATHSIDSHGCVVIEYAAHAVGDRAPEQSQTRRIRFAVKVGYSWTGPVFLRFRPGPGYRQPAYYCERALRSGGPRSKFSAHSRCQILKTL